MTQLVPTINIGYKRWPSESIPELVKSIAHEAYHCYLYNEYLRKNPDAKKVPSFVHSGEKAERQCLTYETFEVGKWLGLNENLEEEFTEALNSRWWETPYWERVDW